LKPEGDLFDAGLFEVCGQADRRAVGRGGFRFGVAGEDVAAGISNPSQQKLRAES
jgi:hypothetical protein